MATMNTISAKNVSPSLPPANFLMPSLGPSVESKEAPTIHKFRIAIALPVEVQGTDLHGKEFTDTAYTEQVSFNGANIVVNRQLGPDQQILLKRNGRQTVAYAVGQIGVRDMSVRDCGYLYAVEVPQDVNQQMWNIVFPPEAESHACFRFIMYCESCKVRENVTLNEMQADVLEINHRLCRTCPSCLTATFWSELKAPTSNEKQSANAVDDRRKQNRLRMKTSACICRPGEQADVTKVLDVSSRGLGFRSAQEYREDTWIRVAVPYVPGSANIFVAGRIAWRRTAADGFYEYGVEYSRK
jgi:hypothetical protein